jgi:thymidine kinase
MANKQLSLPDHAIPTELDLPDLSTLPLSELAVLAEMRDVFPEQVTTAIKRLLDFVNIKVLNEQITTGEELIPPASLHGLAAFLNYCRTIEDGGDFARRVLLPPLDPHTIYPPELNGENILEDWRQQHAIDNNQYASLVWEAMQEALNKGEGQLITITGPMFSGKSGIFFSILDLLARNKDLLHSQGIDTSDNKSVRGFTASVLGETTISSRIHHNEKLYVQPLNLEDLWNLAESPDGHKIVFIDEYSFILFDGGERFTDSSLEERAQMTAVAFNKLRNAGVIVVAVGLDSDYRSRTFDAVEAVKHVPQYENIHIKPTAFYINCGHDGQQEPYQKNGTRTIRYLKGIGIVDPCMNVAVPREWNLVDYGAVPEDLHFMNILESICPEIHAKLMREYPTGGHPRLLELYREYLLEHSET